MNLDSCNTTQAIAVTFSDPSNDPAAEQPPLFIGGKALDTPEEVRSAFRPDWVFYLAFTSLSIIALAAALDATSVSVALPVRFNVSFSYTLVSYK